MRVGFIGVGSIGRPMAEKILSAGFALTVHDLRREAAAPLLAGGAIWADTPRAVAETCEVVCTCLPGPPEMETVVLGPKGIAEGIQPGTVYVDHTTNSPLLVRRVHEMLSKRGVEMLDAPVSGGMEGAQTRDLTVLVGGSKEALEKCRPVLEAMGKTVLHVGEIGAGCICKVMHNCAGFSLSLAMIECLTVGVKAGVEPSMMIEVFQKCAIGRNTDLHGRLPATLFQGSFEPARFALALAHKDMGLATELARAYDVPVGLTEVCQREMSEAMARGWAGSDSSVFLRLQEERAGVEVRLT